MANNNQIYKMSNAGGFKSLNRYYDMLAGNTVWNPWEPQGAYDALSTVTVPSGGVASITFAGIPQGYKHLQIRYSAGNDTGSFQQIRFNSDSGSNYKSHYLFGNGSSAGAGASTTATSIEFGDLPNSTSIQGAGVIDILDYSSTSKNKTARVLAGNDRNGAGVVVMTSGLWMNSSAGISSMTLFALNTYQQNSTFTLYGVR